MVKTTIETNLIQLNLQKMECMHITRQLTCTSTSRYYKGNFWPVLKHAIRMCRVQCREIVYVGSSQLVCFNFCGCF